MTFLELCEKENANPEYWKEWLETNHKDNISPYELIGIAKEEYEDLCNGVHSIDFYLFKSKFPRHIKNVWGGCYVKYVFEIDKHEPHIEFGWVDVVNNDIGFCKVQCDDSFMGTRALTLRILDVVEILPYKERPLVYYKSMVCNECNSCDRMANELPPESCKLFNFFNAIVNKQQADTQFINLYNGILEYQQNQENCNERCSKTCGGNCNNQCSCH